MASAELKELLELAKEAGLEGTELSNFLRDERTRQREREKEEREHQREREEKEREREEKEREREKEEREREEKEREHQREREEKEREREKEEREHHREREKAESDALQREADRRHEIELARLRVEDNVLNRSGQAERNIGSMGSVPKLPSFDEKMDDLDAYLYRFEGYATMQGWPKERWASNLSALLKGNALQVFHRMSLDDSGDYELLKIALLNRYRLTDADFWNKFRQAKPQDGESFSQFGIRITGYLDRWIELSETLLSYEGIRDLLIREQTLGVGSAELRVFIEERTPGSFKEMCNIAEQYLKAHGKSFRHWWMSDKHRSEGHETKGLNSENKNRFSNTTSKFHGRSGQARVNGQSNPTAGRACWICSSVKHYARECPQNKPDRPLQSSKSKVGGNATVLACEEALLFKGGLKLTTKLTVHRDIFKAQQQLVKTMIRQAKFKYYNQQIQDCDGDQRALFRVIGALMSKKTTPVLPTHVSASDLALSFSEFFIGKITSIRETLEAQQQAVPDAPPTSSREPCSVHMSTFTPASIEEVTKIVKRSASTTCSLDPIPTPLLKDCLDELAPSIAQIVNTSLATGHFPAKFKKALVTPIIKKPTLDPDERNNYRPVSNLSFVSKVVERVVAARLNAHLSANSLHECMQSAYRPNHSVETALLKVHNDIVCSLDKKQAVMLILLDLSAAFDTIDHQILLRRLHDDIGVRGVCLRWFSSYLQDRCQSVCIAGVSSPEARLPFGVPQGSVLGPALFVIYTAQIAEITREHLIPGTLLR